MMKDKFVGYETQNKENLGMVIAVLTLGLGWVFAYVRYFDRKYFLNRRLLLKLLKEKEIKLVYSGHESHNDRIENFHFDYNDKHYRIHYYPYNAEFTLDSGYTDENKKVWISTGGYDLLGLFVGDLCERRKNNKIIKYFNCTKNNNDTYNLL